MSVTHAASDAVKHASALKHASAVTRSRGPRYPLTPAQTERMVELSAEVEARLAEMAAVLEAAAGTRIDGAGVYVAELLTPDADQPDVTHVEIVCGPEGCGCYVTLSDGTGWCEFPCGGA